MKLEAVIRELIINRRIKTQIELTEILLSMGYSTTQSNISRILKKLNTVKVVDDSKNTYYVIQPKPLEISGWIKTLINTIQDNGREIVVKTYSGAGQIIGQIIDERNIDNIMACVAGDNSILVLVEDLAKISETVATLKEMFMEN